MRPLCLTFRRGIPLLLALALLSPPLRAQSPRGSLLVLSKGDLTLSVVDPATGEVVWRAPSGPDPHEVIASHDGTRAYISNYVPHNTLTVVDLVNRKALPTIDLGALRNPHGLDFAGGKVWFTAEGASTVGSYDPATSRVDWTFRTGQDRTHMVHVSSDLKRVLTSNIGSGTLSILDQRPGSAPGGSPGSPAGGWEQTVVPTGGGVEGFDVSPDGRMAWAANARDGTISIVDLAGKRVVQTIDADVRSANRLKFTPDGRRVLVSMLASPEVAVFDVASRKEVKRVRVGSGAAGIQVQPDGARAYVACTPDDYVAILDLRSLEVVGHISAGRRPDGLAWVGGGE
jgi:DNA-binding beta-propeller fold protein YncE